MKQKSRPYSFPSDTKDLRATAAVADAAVADALWSKSLGEREIDMKSFSTVNRHRVCVYKRLRPSIHSILFLLRSDRERERTEGCNN